MNLYLLITILLKFVEYFETAPDVLFHVELALLAGVAITLAVVKQGREGLFEAREIGVAKTTSASNQVVSFAELVIVWTKDDRLAPSNGFEQVMYSFPPTSADISHCCIAI